MIQQFKNDPDVKLGITRDGITIARRISGYVEDGKVIVINTRLMGTPAWYGRTFVDYIVMSNKVITMDECVLAVAEWCRAREKHEERRRARLLPVPEQYTPSINRRRPTQRDCRNEPDYPGTPTVVFSLGAPHMTVHDYSVGDHHGSLGVCHRHAPHATSVCGRWGEPNDVRVSVNESKRSLRQLAYADWLKFFTATVP